MGKGLLILVLIGVGIAIGYIGLSFWSSCQIDKGPDMPDAKEATHEFAIKNTGGLVLSSNYEQHGQVKGERLFILHGYWEMRGKSFKFVDADVQLDEKIFGEIKLKRRVGN